VIDCWDAASFFGAISTPKGNEVLLLVSDAGTGSRDYSTQRSRPRPLRRLI
jgi:hypothetical protein